MQLHLRRLTAFAAVAVGLTAQASPASAATTASVLTFGMEHDDGSDDNGRDWSLRSYAVCGTA